MLVKNNLLYNDDGSQVDFRPTPNIGSGTKDIRYILLHFDAASNSTSAVNWLTDKQSGVSADLHITRSGKVTQMAKFNQITWHAGKSAWKGLVGLNKYAIGIEQENMGSVKGVYQDWTEVQIQKCIEVCKALVKAYPSIKEILGHEEVATPAGRKDDPGPKFPMARVRSEVFGNAVTGKTQRKTVTTTLNIRTGPGIDSAVIDQLQEGEKVNVLSVNGNWSEVFVCASGIKGWVSNKYIV